MNEIKKDKFLNFYFFVMYLYTSMPALQFNMMGNSNLFFLIIGYGLTLIAAIKYRINFFNKKLIWIFIIVILWTCAQLIIHGSYFRLSPFIILEILSAFVIIKIFGTSIFQRFENVTYILCIIALIGWFCNLCMFPLIKMVANFFGIEADGEKSTSLIIYTVNMTGNLRNCGFAWEPGRTGCMICVGLLFYLMRTKCKFRSLRFLIMTACIISTMSTTGFSVYFIVVTLCYIAERKINIVYLSAVAAIAVGIFSLPFMGDKMKSLIGDASEKGMSHISRSLTWDSKNKSDAERNFYVPQRFEGLMFSTMNVVNTNYFIGDGRDFQNFYINRVLNWKVKTSEGILEIIVRYGIIIGLCCYYLLYRSSIGISRYFNIRNKWIFFIVFVLINISYNFWEVPIFMAIWMMPIYQKTQRLMTSASHNCHFSKRNQLGISIIH